MIIIIMIWYYCHFTNSVVQNEDSNSLKTYQISYWSFSYEELYAIKCMTVFNISLTILLFDLNKFAI